MIFSYNLILGFQRTLILYNKIMKITFNCFRIVRFHPTAKAVGFPAHLRK